MRMTKIVIQLSIYAVCYSLLVVCSVGGNWFDCRRDDITCSGRGSCDQNTGACEPCVEGWGGYNCGFNTADKLSLCPFCASGLCTSTVPCYCESGQFGQACELQRGLLTCNQTHIVATLKPTTVPERAFVLGYVNNSACHGDISVDGEVSIALGFYDECGSAVEGRTLFLNFSGNSETLHRRYLVLNYFSGISSSMDYLFTLDCFLNDSSTFQFSSAFTTGRKLKNGPRNVLVKQSYHGVKMQFVNPYTLIPIARPVMVGEPLGVLVKLTDTHLYKNVRIETCTASDKPERDKGKETKLINQRCVDRSPLANHIVRQGITRNGRHEIFVISAFKYEFSSFIFVYCDVSVCTTEQDCTHKSTPAFITDLQNEHIFLKHGTV